MGKISLEGMQFYAYHGVYEEERIIGNTFVVDVEIERNFSRAAASDALQDTINYETIYQICRAEMDNTVHLIETLIENIIFGIKNQFNSIQKIKVRVQKNRPIPGHRVSHSAVEMERSFTKTCPRCKSPFYCYGDESCWCFDKNLSSETRDNLQERFSGCLCSNCLSYYGG